MSNQFRTEQVRFEETVTDDLIRQFQLPEDVEKKLKVIVFCKNISEGKRYFDRLRQRMYVTRVRKTPKFEFETLFERYLFIGINSKAIDGLTADYFILSPELLKKGTTEEIDKAIYFGRNATIMSRGL